MKPMLNFIWLIDSYSGVQCVHRLVGRGHICQSQCHQEGVACVTKRCPLLVSSTTCDWLKRRGPRQVDSRQLLNRGPQNSCKQSNTEHTSLDLFSVLYKYEDCPTVSRNRIWFFKNNKSMVKIIYVMLVSFRTSMCEWRWMLLWYVRPSLIPQQTAISVVMTLSARSATLLKVCRLSRCLNIKVLS